MPKRLIAELQERIAFHLGQAEKYRVALEAAQREEKEHGKQVLSVDTSGQLSRKQGPTSKIDYVFALIKQHRKKGLTASEVKQLANAEGVTGGANFPYFIIWQLKKEGSIQQENGRYFPSPETEK